MTIEEKSLIQIQRERLVNTREIYPSDSYLRKNYNGFTLEQYKFLLVRQNFKCAICGELSDILCVDHNHLTGRVRGLLCRSCNTGIGCFKESPRILLSAKRYVSKKFSRLK